MTPATKTARPAKTAKKTATTRPATVKKTAPPKAAPAAKKPAAPAAVKAVKAGWRPDPQQPLLKRYWDGEAFIGGALPADMADAKTPAPTDAEQTQDAIVFRGRAMLVRCPTGDQLGVWERTIGRLDSIGKLEGDGTTEQRTKALKLNTRLQKLVASVLLSDDDKDWLDDRFLDEDLDLTEAAEILTLTMAAFDRLTVTAPQAAPKNGPVARRR